MKYDELLADLRGWGRVCVSYEGSIDELLDKAADAIDKLQSQLREEKYYNVNLTGWMTEEHAKNLWIPVSERLPGPGEVVLVYGKRGGIYTAEHNRNGCWPGSFWKLNSKSHHCEPTHWMPLPEPPKDGV